MKKVLLFLVCIFTLQTVAWADDDKPIQVSQLPQQAQTFIKHYFPNVKVAMAKMETDLFDKSYDVIFTNGDKLEFDKKGAWTEVNCKFSSVPANVIPAQIQKYVATNYPDAKVLKIEKGKRDYEVKLSNGWEIKFDLKFNVIDIDN
ncbi:PepSY-like domain-containing protein [Phocaeicola sp.]